MATTEILNELLDIPGLNASVIVGRDGFVIESVGNLGGMDEDAFGAAVAAVQNGAESMSNELGLSAFHTMTLEASNAMIMCLPAGEALLVILAPDSRTLGMIRLQVKKRLPHLAELL
jgi:predicted regulator of Ras-like GTPase activity (Roadblock/LC7/MglB family)